jgi:hypothetical protein
MLRKTEHRFIFVAVKSDCNIFVPFLQTVKTRFYLLSFVSRQSYWIYKYMNMNMKI